MSADRGHQRQGTITLGLGVALLVVGFVLQAVAVHRAATEAPPMMFSNAGSVTVLSQVGALLILGGVIMTIVGIVRYAQSGGGRVVAAPPGATGPAGVGAYCSSCGHRLVGSGRYCSACGTPASNAR